MACRAQKGIHDEEGSQEAELCDPEYVGYFPSPNQFGLCLVRSVLLEQLITVRKTITIDLLAKLESILCLRPIIRILSFDADQSVQLVRQNLYFAYHYQLNCC